MIRTVPRGKPSAEPEVKRRPGGEEQRSRTGKTWRPSSAPEGSGADWANAKAYFTLPTLDDWMDRFTKEPDIWQNLLGDIYRETKAERERVGGQARIGRRPRAIDGSMDELWRMVTPQYSMDAFPTALRELMKARPEVSWNELSKQTKLPRTTVSKMLSGEAAVDMYRLSRLASFFDVSPSYFREFRESYVLTVISELLASNPNLSIRFARGLTKAAERALPDRPVLRSAR